MIYGIDLGTTNSLIGYRDEFLSELVPSCVNLNTKTVGTKSYLDADAVRSFKTDISMGKEGVLSRAASSEILRYLSKLTKPEANSVVISVPAYFSSNQREATREAATNVGLNVVSLINEPTAAAMYYGKERRKLSMVFDLGGGTFDISVIDNRYGIYDVQETDGLVLGGDDLDEAIFRYVRSQVKFKAHRASKEIFLKFRQYCTEAKIQIQKEGKDVEIDFSTLSDFVINDKAFLSVANYNKLMKQTFMPCLEKTIKIVDSAMHRDDNYDLIFVGGSTRCPYLREWIETELEHKAVEQTYDPDKIVAKGTAYYAGLIEDGNAEELVSDITKAIGVRLADGLMEVMIPSGSKLPISEKRMFTNSTKASSLELSIYQGDSLVAENNSFLGKLIYEFSSVKEAMTVNVETTVSISSDGVCTLLCKEFGKPARKIKLML